MTSGEYKCQDCDTSCGGMCNGVTGVCTGCITNHVPTLVPTQYCIQCSVFDVNCMTCSTGKRECTTCRTQGMYPDETNKTCTSCSSTCDGYCSQTTGYCEKCMNNYVFTQPPGKLCVPCKTFDTNCNLCSSDYTRKCIMCGNGYYPNESGTCVSCTTNNCAQCDSASGICSVCETNYVFTNPPSKTCIRCKAFDIHCNMCSSSFDQRCIQCDVNYYPDTNGICKSCDQTCGGRCNTLNGICTSCLTQYVYTEPKSILCVNCSSFDSSCLSCLNSPERICSICTTGKYVLSNGRCGNCDLTCGGKCDQHNGMCTGCENNYVMYSTSSLTCQSCSAFDANCSACATDYSRKCIKCNAGFYIVNGLCQKCDSTCNNRCDTNSGYCTGCIQNFIKSETNPKQCVECKTLDNNCDICESSGERKCNTCTNYTYVDTTTFKCVPCPTECKNCNGQNGICTSCANNYVMKLNDPSKCEECHIFDINCAVCASDASRKCVTCNNNYYPNTQTFKCQLCDETCNNQCNPMNGYCTSCSNNHVFYPNKDQLQCQSCSVFDPHCKICATDFSRKCVECMNGYYPNLSGQCVLCDSSCTDRCSTTTGICTSCVSGYVLYETSNIKCQNCTDFDSNCLTCSLTSQRKCDVCKSNFFPKTIGDYRCQSCDISCGGKCDGETGYCTGCLNNYVFSSSNKSICEKCDSFDINCATCNINNQRECTSCNSYSYYPDPHLKTCRLCDTSCTGNCGNTDGYCRGCNFNYVFTQPRGNTCVSCKTFDMNCKICSSDFTRKCSECENGYYPDVNHICVPCNTIDTNCNTCNSSSKYCSRCADPYYLNNLICQSCPVGTYKNTETSCELCYNGIPNCQICTITSVNVPICTSCFAPYSLNVNTRRCELCGNFNYFNNITKSCLKNMINCTTEISIEKCLKCSSDNFLLNGKCQSTSKCQRPSQLSLVSCDCFDQISINSDCKDNAAKCKYQKVTNIGSTCLVCEDNNIMTDSGCITITNGEYIRNDKRYSCGENKHLTTQNICEKCDQYTSICSLYNNTVYALSCKQNSIYNVENKTCLQDVICNTTLNGFCSKCIQPNTEIYKGKCQQCTHDNCALCEGGLCKRCSENYLMTSLNKCVLKSDVSCVRSSHFGCVQCNNGFYQVDSKNIEGKYSFCLPLVSTSIPNCKHATLQTRKCVECLDSFKQRNGVCAEFFEENLISSKIVFHNSEKQMNLLSTNQNFTEQFVKNTNETNINYNLEDKKMTHRKSVIETSCLDRTNKGCQRCSFGYYLEHTNINCVQCSSNCESCYNTTYCISCKNGYYLSSSKTCESLGELTSKCYLTLPTGGGCAICNDGFYKQEKDCTTCDASCSTCLDSVSCLVCNESYYKIVNSETKLCLPFDNLINCENKTAIGCVMCSKGYYLQNYMCHSCSSNCSECQNYDFCEKCSSDEFVLINSRCTHYSKIEFCMSASNSKCIQCSGRHEPSTDGDECLDSVYLGVVIGVPLSLVVVLILIVSIIIVLIYFLLMKKQEEVKMRNICVFPMKRSNVEMIQLNNETCDLCCNKKVIKFDLENTEDTPIDVDAETRDLICIGNTSKHDIKVQFSVIEGCDYYEIRSVPPLVNLKRGEACEFEIYIKPLCSCVIDEDIMVIALDIHTCKQTNEKIKVSAKTKKSTKLNYRELEETKKIGEGSFGIVYKGLFKEKIVAIKKLKNANTTKQALDEFDKEVSMLDKFRNDFVIHFYGACYIPSHICMVTEFAEHGSLADMIYKEKEIDLKMKIKFMLDCGRGVAYLHENGILHRDIKPDNILVITLEKNIKANGKLTDFGSSRNINMLMTNMTFTKGVGTPKYMAQEILNKQHYKKSADVFSLAVTFYETLVWGEIYPSSMFKHAWSIADFVSEGKRRQCLENMNQDAYDIINKMWDPKQENRPTINTSVDSMQQLFNTHLLIGINFL
ncbi:protein serine/threonine kinase, putative [Entamoeba invadens IP1]|uniref:Protein serine/threonine kinase, putative n=1 Tax=Entamoeba invadens IP1 TaxID=370355 RepID=A0A0A1UCB4_ENTIV|nr:protein serine/threonine kinase, putative [Entamoeba invadens IP1]ELP89915.1 protein serine/threonine kinase, putative [Entamoeba invadens IP1]|eukprot:XP_004256686.1 protein serine/threonine kinase, putative [Entamoeba invadens IP1]